MAACGGTVGGPKTVTAAGANQRRGWADFEPIVRQAPNRPPRAYVCVYRQVFPARQVFWDLADEAATAHPDLAELVRRYRSKKSFYDWGDDPSFFSAEYHQGSSSFGAWGVCRRNVRKQLYPGDIVVYFCARRFAPGAPTEYFYIGVGTVGVRVQDRRQIWLEDADPALRPYRNHLNILVSYDADGAQVQHERFAPGHPDDWPRRAECPYIVFEPKRSRFNLKAPTLVAVAGAGDARETWRPAEDQRVAEVERVLFTDLGVGRRLRTSHTGSAHPHLNLTANLAGAGVSVAELRKCLWTLV
jgi:hypothetical protein